jgi:hypothetical protein
MSEPIAQLEERYDQMAGWIEGRREDRRDRE